MMNRKAPETLRPSSAPRLAESAPELIQAIRRLSREGVVEPRVGIIHPTIRAYKGGADYVYIDDELQRRVYAGMCTQSVPDDERKSFDIQLENDRIEVVLLTRWGYGSSYQNPTVLRVLHKPLYNGFRGRAALHRQDKARMDKGARAFAGVEQLAA